METYQKNYQDFLHLNKYSRMTGATVPQLQRLRDKDLRQHIASLHALGRPLSEIAEYIAIYYDVDIRPQVLKKSMQRFDTDAWSKSVHEYRQHKAMKQAERSLSAIGANHAL